MLSVQNNQQEARTWCHRREYKQIHEHLGRSELDGLLRKDSRDEAACGNIVQGPPGAGQHQATHEEAQAVTWMQKRRKKMC